MNRYWISLLFGILFLSGCEEALLPADYVRFVQDEQNGLRKVDQVGKMKFDLQFKPLPYLVAMDQRSNDITPEKYEEKENALEGQHHYNLKLDMINSDVEKIGVRSEEDWSNRLQYLAFDMKNDIRLVVGQDTLAPSLYHFERSYNISSYRSFVLSFPKHKGHDGLDQQLIFDSPLFNTGRVKFKIEQEAIAALPKMRLKT